MAWKGNTAWKNQISKPKDDDSSFPGLKPAPAEAAAAKIEHEELQQNELLVLEAIYGEDFVSQNDDGHSAWKVSISESFVVVAILLTLTRWPENRAVFRYSHKSSYRSRLLCYIRLCHECHVPKDPTAYYCQRQRRLARCDDVQDPAVSRHTTQDLR